MRKTALLLCLPAVMVLGSFGAGHAQQEEFTRADTLRGSITPERAWWEVIHYDLNVTVQPSDSSLLGYNRITYRVSRQPAEMQIDLQQPLQMDQVIQGGASLDYRRDGDAFFVQVPEQLARDSLYTLTVYYHGRPRVAPNAPWEGGFVWERDTTGTPWIATANQGLGASVWWPNKDHQSAEPDSMRISVTVPDSLINVSNGRLSDVRYHPNGTATWTWGVDSPINNYNVAVNAGDYFHFNGTYQGEKGPLDLDFWVLDYNLDKALGQFGEVGHMLQCFERWFGPYPFYEDGYKLVETPHLGMEHQSAVAYGNDYQMGYQGTDLSDTGWGLKFDFIIIHESGHEWWGNSVTTKDIADMWVHEGFTNYSENLYVECRWGAKAGADYVIGTRKRIQNERPIIGPYGVNREGSGDMYYKGGNLLHMIRRLIDDDGQWREILRGIQSDFRHQTVTSRQIESYINKRTEADLRPVFNQYLRFTDIPVLQYYLAGGRLHFRWAAGAEDFDMPVDVRLSGEGWTRIRPVNGQWRSVESELDDPGGFRVDRDFYILTERYSRE